MSREKLDFIYRRQSVRSFLDTPVPEEDIRELLAAATRAPSGKNLQNWHFVVVRNQEKIQRIADIVVEKNAELARFIPDETERKDFTAFVKYHTVFRHAPVLILVYASPYPTIADTLSRWGTAPEEALEQLRRANPGIQNIAAAMENLLLAAAALGYGACWMTGPTYAAEEITRFLQFDRKDYCLAAMTPLGIPAPKAVISPPRKPVDEVATFMD